MNNWSFPSPGARCRRWIGGPICLLLTGMLVACGDAELIDPGDGGIDQTPTVSGETDTHEAQAVEFRFSDSQDAIWPPQPRGMTQVQTLPLQVLTGRDDLATVKQLAMRDTAVAGALGDNYQNFASHIEGSKDGGDRSVAFEFYNYDSNETIAVQVDATDEVRVNRTGALEYQPPESLQERQNAVALAAIALREQGFADLNALKGTALLAYPSEREVAATGSQFYAQRMLYVTFGPGDGKLPVYSALVNLSDNVVVRSGPVQ